MRVRRSVLGPVSVSAKPRDNSLAQSVAECGSIPWQWTGFTDLPEPIAPGS